MKNTNKVLSILVTAIMLIGMYYNSYRYPFMINSTQTSPTYSDTPEWLSFGKYLLVFIVLACALFAKVLVSKKLQIYKPLYALAYLYLSLIPIVCGIFTENTTFIQSGIFFFIPFVLHFFVNNSISIKPINKIILTAIYVSIISEIIQIFLFLCYGRLPALAYLDSLSVRFGSFLDDPNGFGILLALFFGFSMIYYRGVRKVIILITLFFFSLLTQSLTAILAFLFSVAAYMLVLFYRPGQLLQALLLTGSVFMTAFLTFLFWNTPWKIITQVLENKSDSIEAHSTAFDLFSKLTFLNLFGLNSHGQTGESGYTNLLMNFGLFYLLVYICIGLVAIGTYYKVLLNRNASTSTKAFASAAFLFLISVYSATINLPFEEIFPINLFLALILGLTSSNVLRESTPTSVAKVPHNKQHILS